MPSTFSLSRECHVNLSRDPQDRASATYTKSGEARVRLASWPSRQHRSQPKAKYDDSLRGLVGIDLDRYQSILIYGKCVINLCTIEWQRHLR